MFAAVVLGIVQGLTEFLPISSSGHLVLTRAILGFDSIDPAYNVFVQGGTVISVLIFFRHQLLQLNRRYLLLLLLGTIPAGLIGLLLGDKIDTIFSSLWGVAFGFALTTLVVILSRRSPHTSLPLTPKRSFLVGLAQAASILPGLSRSGSTITASLLLGIPASQAFTYSFLLSIPTVAGASLISLGSLTWNSELIPAYLIGFFLASITGYLSLAILARLVSQGRFYLFAPYTAALTVLTLLLALN